MSKQTVYVVTGFFAAFQDYGYTSPSEEFVCNTYDDALKLQQEMLSDPNYEDVCIDGPVEREVWL